MASRPRTRSRNRPVHTGAPSPRLLRLAREAGWLLSAGGAAYIGLVLFTYHAGDPGWSHNGEALSVANAGGHFGAWLADLLLYLFGFSAYWFAVAALMTIWWGYCLIDHAKSADRHSVLAAVTGFGLLLAAGSGFAALYAQSWGAGLPAGAGGVVGDLVAPLAAAALGVTGAGLAFALIAAVGLSFFIGLSWLHVLELLGTGVEWLGGTAVAAARRWKTRFARRDRAAASLLLPAEPVHEADAYADPNLADEPAFDAGGEAPTAVKARRKREPARRPEPLPAEDFSPPLVEDLPWEPLAIITPPPPRLAQQLSGIREVGDAADLLPPLDLLDSAKDAPASVSPDTIEYISRLIERKLAEFGVQVKVLAAYPGPVITRYEVEPATGVKGSQVVNLMKDLSRALSLVSIRVVETIPGKSCMGLELPNPKRQVVRLSEIINSAPYVDMDSSLTIAMGKDISGQPVVANLAKMPHVLVAGTTGSGKSVAINAMILSLIYKSTPKDVRLILIDPKMLELSVYEGIPHLLAPVVTDMKQAAHALNWCVGEMERRYKVMSLLGVRNLAGFNQKIEDARERGESLKNPLSLTPEAPEPLEAMPVIVVVIDELADLMMVVGKKIEELIARLAQKARAAGVHLVLATQRPSVDVITGLIKANVPTRVAFQVSSKIDSRTILDQMGAETLLGQGDMLYLPPGSGYTQRIHGAYVSDQEVHRVVDYLKEHGEPQYVEAILTGADAGESGAGEGAESGGPEADGESDALYDQAVAVVLKNRRASISLVQRHLRVGYNRAARLLEQMERSGLVSAMQSNGNREVLAPVSNEA